MRNSKLCQHLFILDKKERKAFEDFLNSPYFNKRKDVQALFRVLQEEILPYQRQNLSEEECYQRIFPEKAFNTNQFRKLKSRLLSLFLEFVALEEYRRSPLKQQHSLLKTLNEKGGSSLFESHFEGTEKIVAAQKRRDELFWEQSFEIETERTVYSVEHGLRGKDNNFEDLFSRLRTVSLYRELRYGYILLNQKQIVGDLALSLTEKAELAIRTAAPEIEKQAAGVRIYYRLGMAMLEPGLRLHFDILLSLLDENALYFAPAEQKDMFTGAVNYCIRRVNGGDRDFQIPLLALYQQMLDLGILQDRNGDLSPFHFKNVVSLGARLDKFEWVANLIETQGPRLKGNHAEAILAFNRGVLAFFMEDLAQAEQYFHSAVAVREDIFYSLDIRFYLLLIHYERGNSIGMESLAHAFRLYISRHKSIGEARRQRYLTFIRWFRRLYQVPPYASDKIQKLKEEIEAEPMDSGRDWLLKKLTTLQEKRAGTSRPFFDKNRQI